MSNDTPLTVVGNLTADPEIGFTQSGAAWCRFTVASTPRRFDKTAGDYVDGETLFMRCTAWRDLADHATESLTKGMRVMVTGRLRQQNWETDDGDKRSMIVLDVDDVGPSLRWATAKVQRTQRSGAHDGPPAPTDDPWTRATSSGTQTTETAEEREPVGAASGTAGPGGAAGGRGYDEPPF